MFTPQGMARAAVRLLRSAAHRRAETFAASLGHLVNQLTVEELIALADYFHRHYEKAVARMEAAKTSEARDSAHELAQGYMALHQRPHALLMRMAATLPDPRSAP